jgi:penicillin-binding protein 2
MSIKFALKNIAEETRIIKRRVYFSAVIILLFVTLVLSQLFYLQILQQDHYVTLSKNNRVKVLPIPPIRGLIYSHDGVLLAENQPSFSLEIVPEQIENLDNVINELKHLVSIQDEDVNRFKKEIGEKRHFESVPIRYNLSEQEVARFVVNNHLFPGIEVVARLYRRYPLKDITSHVIGYVGRIDDDDLDELDKSNYLGTTHIGKLGIEQAYEKLLHGKVGYQQVEINAQGRILRVLERTPPEPGKNIYLTLDISFQKLAVDVLKGKRGAIVALDPTTGDILAMVSAPGYDPNPFVNGIDTKSYQKLINSSDKPFINRVIQGKYPPGSTIKPFLGAVGLAYGVRESNDTIWCPGWFSLKGSTHRYRDWKKGGHGHVDLNYAIIQSCDVYYYTLANDLGINRLHNGLSAFGFGEQTGIDINGESSGLVPSVEWKRKTYKQPWYQGETVIAGIGQGSLLATPLQLARATAALANSGKLMSPHLAYAAKDSITGSEQSLKHPASRPVSYFDPQIWHEIRSAMESVVHGDFGTARRSGFNAQYHFAGKTGTSQIIGIAQDEQYKKEDVPEELRDHALFIAFAPVENPRIAVAIIVENGGSGSGAAAPIARILFDKYLLGQLPDIEDGRTISGTTVTH